MITAIVSREPFANEPGIEPSYTVTFYDDGIIAGALKTADVIAGAVVAALRGAGVVTVYDLTATTDEAPDDDTVV